MRRHAAPVVFRGWFDFELAKLIETDFSRVTVLHYNRLGDGVTVDDWIRQTSPDVVIIETVERDLDQILPMLEQRP